jgi:hypothetical protein
MHCKNTATLAEGSHMSGRVKRHVRRAMGNGGILIRSNGRAADGRPL